MLSLALLGSATAELVNFRLISGADNFTARYYLISLTDNGHGHFKVRTTMTVAGGEPKPDNYINFNVDCINREIIPGDWAIGELSGKEVKSSYIKILSGAPASEHFHEYNIWYGVCKSVDQKFRWPPN
jgi:hypothetical protein